MSRHNSGDDGGAFQFMIVVIVAGILLTWIGDVWIHWLVIFAAFLVGCWAIQSTGKQKIEDDRERDKTHPH